MCFVGSSFDLGELLSCPFIMYSFAYSVKQNCGFYLSAAHFPFPDPEFDPDPGLVHVLSRSTGRKDTRGSEGVI